LEALVETGVLVLVGLVVLFLALATPFWIWTRRAKAGLSLVTNKSPQEVAVVARSVLKPPFWTEVDGPGLVNARRRVLPAGRGPTVSVDAAARADQGVEVHLWMSRWTERLGMAQAGEYAYSKMKKIARLLGE
jgi:hypothetical protein